jgi:DNA-binding NarL/FixJ family response regulator
MCPSCFIYKLKQLHYGLGHWFRESARAKKENIGLHVLLVDDHTMFRQGLKFLLSDLDESLVFSEAGNCEQALEQLEETSVNLILLDLNMPGMNGIGALQAVTTAAPTTPLAVLSGEDQPALIRAAVEAGASGFVPKSSSSEVLVAALQLILAGGVYLPQNVLHERQTDSSAPQTTSSADQASKLSERQTAVLLRAIQGQPNKVIAIDLGIAEGTVKSHLSAAFRVLGVNNRIEAVFAAAKLGLKPA